METHFLKKKTSVQYLHHFNTYRQFLNATQCILQIWLVFKYPYFRVFQLPSDQLLCISDVPPYLDENTLSLFCTEGYKLMHKTERPRQNFLSTIGASQTEFILCSWPTCNLRGNCIWMQYTIRWALSYYLLLWSPYIYTKHVIGLFCKKWFHYKKSMWLVFGCTSVESYS